MLRTETTSRKRNSSEIVAEILRIAQRGAKKIRIVYKANLNFKMLDEYIKKLEESGLVTGYQDDDRLIRTTEKGKEYLQKYSELEEFAIY